MLQSPQNNTLPPNPTMFKTFAAVLFALIIPIVPRAIPTTGIKGPEIILRIPKAIPFFVFAILSSFHL